MSLTTRKYPTVVGRTFLEQFISVLQIERAEKKSLLTHKNSKCLKLQCFAIYDNTIL